MVVLLVLPCQFGIRRLGAVLQDTQALVLISLSLKFESVDAP
jgi:hypothetical protein